MARLDWIDSRLKNWERWYCSMHGKGLGFASQSVLLNDLPGADREIRIPIDDIEGSITHDAVESLKDDRPRVYEVLYLVYPFGQGAGGAAKRLQCARSNVYALLEVGDRVLAEWFTRRSEQQAALRHAREAADGARK